MPIFDARRLYLCVAASSVIFCKYCTHLLLAVGALRALQPAQPTVAASDRNRAHRLSVTDSGTDFNTTVPVVLGTQLTACHRQSSSFTAGLGGVCDNLSRYPCLFTLQKSEFSRRSGRGFRRLFAIWTAATPRDCLGARQHRQGRHEAVAQCGTTWSTLATRDSASRPHCRRSDRRLSPAGHG